VRPQFEAVSQLSKAERRIVRALIEGMVITHPVRRVVDNMSSHGEAHANPQALLEKIRALPPERLGEVEDFIDFLSAKSRRLAALDRLLAVAPAPQVAGVPEMSMDEINEEVAAVRAERRAVRGVADRS
jgi:hypothetical protein